NPSSSLRPGRPAWNKGKMPGPKPQLRPGHVWAIRAKLQIEKRTRDLAMFNLAIDSKLRACDLMALRVDDVAPNSYAIDRATIRQRKTAHLVRFELTEPTRQALDDYLRITDRKPGEYLFPGRKEVTLIYRRTGNLRAAPLLLGHTRIESTVRYLGVEVDDALEIAEKVDI